MSWRRSRRALAVALATIAVGMFAVPGLSRLSVDTRLASFVPTHDPAYRDLQQRDREFGSDPIAVVLKGSTPKGLLLDQEQLERMVGLEGRLSRLDNVAAVYGPGTVLNQTAKSMTNLLLQISGRRDALENAARELAKRQGLGAAEKQERVRKALLRFDKRYGGLIVRAMPMGLPTLKNSKFVASVLFGEDGEPRSQWKFLVPDSRTSAILVRPGEGLDENETRLLVSAVRTTVKEADLATESVDVSGVPVLTTEVAGQAKRELPLLGAAAFLAVGLVFLVSPWSRRRLARLQPLAIALTGTGLTLAGIGWSGREVSLGVVAFLPILLGIASDFPLYLLQHADRRRILVAAGAAAAGFGSLAISPLPFVKELGITLAVGLAVTCLLGLAARSLLPVIEPCAAVETDVRGIRTFGPRTRGLVLVVALAASILGWIALPRISIEASPDQLAKGLPALAQARSVEGTLGFSGEVTVLTHGKNVLSAEVLKWSEDVEDQVIRSHGDQMRPIFTVASLLRFLGDDATPEQVQAAANLVPPYLLNAVVTPDNKTAAMFFGVELRDVRAQSRLLDDVMSSLPPTPAGLDSKVVGLPVLAARTLELMSTNRILLNVVGILLAVLVLGIFLPQRSDALRALAAVAFAAGWVFGLTSLLGSVSPLTVAAGALITVTGCEFTVLMSGAVRNGQAWLMRTVGTAAVAGSVGYASLSLSRLALLRDFGLLLAVSVCFSYVAARLVVAVAPPRRLDGAADLAASTLTPRTLQETPA